MNVFSLAIEFLAVNKGLIMAFQFQHISSCFFDNYVELSVHFLNTVQTAVESLTFSVAFIYLIHLQGNKYREAEELFDNLLNDENSPLKPEVQQAPPLVAVRD